MPYPITNYYHFFFRLVSIVFLNLFLPGCGNTPEGIKGEGEVVERIAELSPIYGVRSDIPGEIILTQAHDRPQRIAITGQQNIIDQLEMKVERNGIFSVRIKDGLHIQDFSTLKIEMDISTLRFVELNGSGSVLCPATFYRLDELEVMLNGSGKIILKPEAIKIKAALAGSGEIQLFGLCGTLENRIEGSGDIRAFGLLTNQAVCSIEGSGNIEVTAEKSLTASTKGSGNIYFKGNPTLTKSIVGSGEIKKLTE